jgi:hypothetical protein
MVRWLTRERVLTARAVRRTMWQRWFAWHPVIVKANDELEHWVWFERLERKWSLGKYGGGHWRYRHPLARQRSAGRGKESPQRRSEDRAPFKASDNVTPLERSERSLHRKR